MAGPFGLRQAAAAVVATGIRPCSGALVVLVFALSQGLFLTGVAATLAMALGTALTVMVIAVIAVHGRGIADRLATRRPGPGLIAIRGLEIAAGLAILSVGGLFLGALLLGGAPGGG